MPHQRTTPTQRHAKAMLLAGGKSTRLYPLTIAVPKPLVPVGGEPISGHIMRWLASYGYDRIGINIHYHADAIREAFGDGSRYGVQLEYLVEPQLTGSAGAVKGLEPFFDETFVVVGCDDLTDADLGALVAFHKERGALATIGLVECDEVDQYGVVITADDGRIVEFQEKPPKGTERSKLVNTGIYVFEPEIFAHIPADTFYDFGKNVFPALQAANAAFYGLRLPETYWRDVGTLSEYRAATQDVLSGRIHLPGARANGILDDVQHGAGLHVDGNVRVGNDVVLGDRVRLIGPVVIGDGVRICNDVTIERSIVWNDVRVGSRARIVDSIVGIGYDVPDDTSLIERIVANEPIAT
jgi:mannose-1-phosphate guanylyltransferase